MEKARRVNFTGHFWTIAPNLWRRWRPFSTPPAESWETTLVDPVVGDVVLRGVWQPPASGIDTAVVVVHGMGGAVDRHYCVRAARAAARRGWGCLRMGLRGADRQGDDFHHAGLHEDIAAAVNSEALGSVVRIFLLGYSLGGHTVLRYLSADPDPRVRGGATVCTPVDLDRAARYLDEECSGVYRRHLLEGLKEIYDTVARRREVPVPAETVRAVRTVREFDALTIARRFGFDSAEDYYAREGAVGHLDRLQRPVLFAASTRDPILPPAVLRPALNGAPELLRVHWINRGGHVNFPESVDLGIGAEGELEDQLLDSMGAWGE